MSSSRRSSPLPKGWSAIRLAVLKRDRYICKYVRGCTNRANEVDHINDPMDHSMANLRAICHQHHLIRTAMQASSVARANRVRYPRKRPQSSHPGIIASHDGKDNDNGR